MMATRMRNMASTRLSPNRNRVTKDVKSCGLARVPGFPDRLDPAVELALGGLDYPVFECIGERTLAYGHRDRMRTNVAVSTTSRRLQAVLPHRHP